MNSPNFIHRLKWEWLSITALVIGLLIALVPIFLTSPQQTLQPSLESREQVAEIKDHLNEAVKTINQLQAKLDALSNIPEQAKVAVQLKDLQNNLKDLWTRESKLEEVILSNPAKAIEVPLIRKDLDNLKDAQQQNMLAVKQGVDQVYDLNKWLLGAMAVSIVTLAISNLIKGKEKETSA